jgi:membrane carboxypeptidase/penicillin-binding protein PbpC
MTAATILHDNPTDFGNYKPQNYDRKFRGNVTIRRSLANSLNVPAVELLQKVGVNDAISLAHDMGISTLQDANKYGLSLVLGGGEVKLFELTRAYGVLANQGVLVSTHPVLEIKDKYGKEVYNYSPLGNAERDSVDNGILGLFKNTDYKSQAHITDIEGTDRKRVIDAGYTYITTSILSDDRARSEAFGSGSALLISRPAAAKTGTTDSYRDSWTVGYTPSFVTGVWIGNNDNSPMLSVAGSIGAAPIWHNVMEAYLRGKPVEEFQKPSTVVQKEVCRDAGMEGLLGSCSGCKDKYPEVFVESALPQACTVEVPTQTPAPTPGPTDTPAPQPTSVPATPTSAPTPTGIVFPTQTPTNTPIPLPTL